MKSFNSIFYTVIIFLTSTNHVNMLREDVVCCAAYVLDTSEQCTANCCRPCFYVFCKDSSFFEDQESFETRELKCVPVYKKQISNGNCSESNDCVCQNELYDPSKAEQCLLLNVLKCVKYSKGMKSLASKLVRCQCIDGYATNEKTETCKYYLKSECGIASETCSSKREFEFHNVKPNCIQKCIEDNVCDKGYELNKINEICEPICKDKIENSRCIKPPDTWKCIENYQHDRRIDKCVLDNCSCNSNGYCPNDEDKCVCYDGFTKDNISGQCEPQCQPLCVNSNCIANNVCECLDEHHKTAKSHICEKNDICNGRPCENGECLITGKCKCKAGYFKSLSFKGQIQCDIVQKFVGKLMAMILGVPVLLTCSVFLVICAVAKKNSYSQEEQEMILINRS